MTDPPKIFVMFFSEMIHCLLVKLVRVASVYLFTLCQWCCSSLVSIGYFHQFLINANDTFVEPVCPHPQYDMAMTLIVSCLLAIYLSIFNGFSAIIAVFFTLLRDKVSNNYLTFFLMLQIVF